MSAPPNDPVAELAIVGSMAVWPVNVPMILQALDAGDFYTPKCQRIFMAIKTLHESGQGIETSGILNELRKLGENDWSVLTTAQGNAERNVTSALSVVAQMALRRRLQLEGLELQKAAADFTADPFDALETARTSLAAIDTPLGIREPDDEHWDDFLDRASATPTPWVLKGLLREGWRTVIVAGEGMGKTWLLRQFAVCAAYGIEPLRFGLDRPVRTLLIDLENPEDHLHESLDTLIRRAKLHSKESSPTRRLWRRPGGIDLRKRADRAEIETLLTRRRPELVVLGPLYKSYRASGSDTSWELAAREVQSVLDDWRARFGISLLIEDHAPGAAGGRRDIRPYGSSLWLRWPEIGIALTQTNNPNQLDVSRWRGDRMTNDWPTSIVRGTPWPWTGRWENGMQEIAS